MKREELERLEWHTGEDGGANGSGGPFIYAPELDDEEGMRLAAAAPALALACLDARNQIYFEIIFALTGYPCHQEALLSKLDAALASAGVEVSDGD